MDENLRQKGFLRRSDQRGLNASDVVRGALIPLAVLGGVPVRGWADDWRGVTAGMERPVVLQTFVFLFDSGGVLMIQYENDFQFKNVGFACGAACRGGT